MDPRLTSWAVAAEDIVLIKECLGKMRQEIEATSILLLDHSGQVISSLSRRGAPSEVTVGALLAGTLAGSRELARTLRESDFRTLIQEGSHESVYAEMVEDDWILAVIFSKQTLLGMVKLMSKKTVEELKGVLAQVKNNSRERDRQLSLQLRDNIQNTLDSLFDNLELGVGS